MHFDLKYPWQQLVLDAFREFDPARLRWKVDQAEGAISKRLRDPREPDLDEQSALKDAVHALRVLLPSRDRQAKENQEENKSTPIEN